MTDLLLKETMNSQSLDMQDKVEGGSLLMKERTQSKTIQTEESNAFGIGFMVIESTFIVG